MSQRCWHGGIKRLQARGDMQFIRVTKESEIDAFLEAACGISKKMWQFVHYRWGIGAQDIDVVRGEMQFLARRGWLRSYLLKCGTVPCSFIIGQQYGLTFYTAGAGLHPAWRSYSAGTFSFCSLWKTRSEKIPLSFTTWLAMQSSGNISATKAIRKHLCGSSAGKRIPCWQAASTARPSSPRATRSHI